MGLQEKILSTENKLVALRKVASGLEQELEEIKTTAANPVPARRTNNKAKRIQSIAEFYLKRKIAGFTK
jgi:hypothetical protein